MTKVINQSRNIEILGEKIKIEKLSIGEIARLLEVIEGFPVALMQLKKDASDQEFMRVLPMLIIQSIEKFAKALVFVCKNEKVDEKFITDKCGMVELLSLIDVIIEVNELQKIMKLIKKIRGQEDRQ